MKRYRLITVCSLSAVLLMANPSSGGVTLTFNSQFSEFSNLNGIGVDSTGNILTVDSNTGLVRKYSQSGTLLAERFIGSGIADVTAGAFGNIFVTEGIPHISILDSDLNLQSRPSLGSSFPYSIASFSNGELVVSDLHNHRIYTMNSTATNTISQFNTTPDPTGVATNSANDILVADPTTNTLRRYTSAGSLIQSTGFADPFGVATDNAGNVYLADGGTGQIRVLNSGLVQQSGFNSGGFAEDVAWAANGRLIASIGNNRVQVLDTSFVVSGNETIADGSVFSLDITNSSGNSAVISGSVTTATNVQNGGTVSVDLGTTLNAAAVNNTGVFNLDGTVVATFNNNAGSTLSGTGTIDGVLAVNNGSTLAPGDSPGTMAAGNTTFGDGGTFQLEVNDFTGTAGSDPGWDLLAITGTLDITATAGDPFIVELDSLTLANASGDAVNFDAASNFSLTFVTTTAGITGFAPNLFSIDTSSFTNTFTGAFSIAQIGDNLALQYTAVPEPSSLAILAIALIGLGIAYQRKRRVIPTK